MSRTKQSRSKSGRRQLTPPANEKKEEFVEPGLRRIPTSWGRAREVDYLRAFRRNVLRRLRRAGERRLLDLGLRRTAWRFLKAEVITAPLAPKPLTNRLLTRSSKVASSPSANAAELQAWLFNCLQLQPTQPRLNFSHRRSWRTGLGDRIEYNRGDGDEIHRLREELENTTKQVSGQFKAPDKTISEVIVETGDPTLIRKLRKFLSHCRLTNSHLAAQAAALAAYAATVTDPATMAFVDSKLETYGAALEGDEAARHRLTSVAIAVRGGKARAKQRTEEHSRDASEAQKEYDDRWRAGGETSKEIIKGLAEKHWVKVETMREWVQPRRRTDALLKERALKEYNDRRSRCEKSDGIIRSLARKYKRDKAKIRSWVRPNRRKSGSEQS